MDEKPSRAGYPSWAAPGLGLLVGMFLSYATLLQTEPLSPYPPLTTLAIGGGIGCLAGLLIGLRERFRR